MKNLSIFQKLLLSHLFIGICTLLLVACLFYFSSKNALIERTVAQLSSINGLKQTNIEDYFDRMRQYTQLLARNKPVLDLLQKRPAQADTAEVHAQFALFQQEFMYQDLLLFDTTLHLVYQQAGSFRLLPQPPEFYTFLQASLKETQVGEIHLAQKHRLFTSAPVKNHLGKTIGILILGLSTAPLEYVLHLRTGIGKTGESYLVGDDFRMRSKSRFFPELAPEQIEVRTVATQHAFRRLTTPHLLTDYRRVLVLSVYHHLNIPGLNWVIVSEIDLEEAMLPVHQMRTVMMLIGIGVCIVIALLTWFVSIPLSQRIGRLRQVVLQLAKGVLPKKLLPVRNRDEIGQMKEAINQLILGMQRTSSFASEIGNGHLQSSYQPLSPEDLMGNALLQMRDKLQTSQEKEALLRRQRTTALLEGEENERRRIARELHDGIGQLLTAIQFKLNDIDGQDTVREGIKTILDETTTEVRRISHNLMPSVLLDFGLEAALRSLCNRTAQTTGWKVNFSFDTHPEAAALPQEFTISLYRIAQEGIHNAIKYANASRIDMIVDHEPDHLQLRIRDNGIGFDWETYQQQPTQDANGIRNMRERIHLLGGTFQFVSQAGSGTTLTVWISLPQSS